MNSLPLNFHSEPCTDNISCLHLDLGILPHQHVAWNNFAAQLKICIHFSTVGSISNTAANGSGLTSVLESEIASLRARLEAIAALKPALNSLYGVLSSRQRLRADRLLRMHCSIASPDRPLPSCNQPGVSSQLAHVRTQSAGVLKRLSRVRRVPLKPEQPEIVGSGRFSVLRVAAITDP